MKSTHSILIILICLVFGCQKDDNDVVLSQQDYQIYNLVLNEMFPDEETLVVRQQTEYIDSWMIELIKDRLEENGSNYGVSLINDFIERNNTTILLNNLSAQDNEVNIITAKEMEIFFPGNILSEAGWDRFYDKYPRAIGIIDLARIGYNRGGNVALVYIHKWVDLHKGGKRKILILKKENAKWFIIEDITL